MTDGCVNTSLGWPLGIQGCLEIKGAEKEGGVGKRRRDSFVKHWA